MKRSISLIVSMLLVFCLAGCSNENATTETVAVTASTEKVITPNLRFEAYETMLYCGESLQLSLVQTPQSDSKVLWESSNEEVATVDERGIVVGCSAGTVTISAKLASDDLVTASAEITVGRHVSEIVLPQTELNLLAGSDKADMQLQYQILPEDALCKDISIKSSDEAVVAVDENGMLHAQAPGMSIITVTSNDDTYSESVQCTVFVKQGVSSISLGENQTVFYLGDDLTLSAEVQPDDAENNAVVWSSSDETVASVDQNGRITAVNPGIVDIICTAQDGSGVSGKCTINVVVGVKKLAIHGENTPLLLGANQELSQMQLVCEVTPENSSYQDVKWVSSDEKIAIVNENGLVQGKAPGEVVITSYSTDPRIAEKVNAKLTVKVGNAVQKIDIVGGADRMAKGTSAKLSSEIAPDLVINKNVTWESSDENILTVNASGSVRAVGVGKAIVTCTAQDGSGVSSKQEITVYQSVTGVQAVQGETVLFAGEEEKIQVKVLPADATDKSLRWESSDSRIATVDSNGKVTGKQAGKVTITATACDGSGKKCTFNVIVEPEVPVTIEKMGFGIYNANLLGLTVKNQCTKHTIANFDFTLALYTYDGSKFSDSIYSLGKDVRVSAGQTSTIKRTLAGVSWTSKLVISITGVQFTDGTYYSIPWAAREVYSFTR